MLVYSYTCVLFYSCVIVLSYLLNFIRVCYVFITLSVCVLEYFYTCILVVIAEEGFDLFQSELKFHKCQQFVLRIVLLCGCGVRATWR